MRKTRMVLAVAFLSLSFSGLSRAATGRERASAKEVIAKVRQAARVLSKTGNLAQFDRKQGPWVWKDSYIFVIDCNKRVMVAHPIARRLIGQSIGSIKDTRGDRPFPRPARYCKAARAPSGVWTEYRWPRPGEKKDSRKLSYSLGVKGTPYVVGAGIYDTTDTIARLSQLTSKK